MCLAETTDAVRHQHEHESDERLARRRFLMGGGALAAGTATMIPAFTLTGTAEEVGARVVALAEAGVTEVAFQPGGPDVERELRSLAEAVAGARLP